MGHGMTYDDKTYLNHLTCVTKGGCTFGCTQGYLFHTRIIPLDQIRQLRDGTARGRLGVNDVLQFGHQDGAMMTGETPAYIGILFDLGPILWHKKYLYTGSPRVRCASNIRSSHAMRLVTLLTFDTRL